MIMLAIPPGCRSRHQYNVPLLYKLIMKEFTTNQVDDMIRLKFGQLVSSQFNRSYISNRVLGKIFGVSGSQIRRLYLARFEAIKTKDLMGFLQ